MIKYSAKEYFFRAALCHLCVDIVNAQHAVTRYEEQFPAFGDSREAKLIKVRDKRRKIYCARNLSFSHKKNIDEVKENPKNIPTDQGFNGDHFHFFVDFLT